MSRDENVIRIVDRFLVQMPYIAEVDLKVQNSTTSRASAPNLLGPVYTINVFIDQTE